MNPSSIFRIIYCNLYMVGSFSKFYVLCLHILLDLSLRINMDYNHQTFRVTSSCARAMSVGFLLVQLLISCIALFFVVLILYCLATVVHHIHGLFAIL